MNLNDRLVNEIFKECTEFVDKKLSLYNYSSDIKHLLYIIIPAFIVKYDYKNKNKILNVFRNVPLIETNEEDKRIQAFYTSIPKYINNELITNKFVLIKHYLNKDLMELIDNIIHEYNHAVNSYENEIKIGKTKIYIRTGLSYARYDKTSLKPMGIDNKEILEEILNTKQTEEIVNIIKEFTKYTFSNTVINNSLYSINNYIDKSYKSKAYSLQTLITNDLTNNKTLFNVLSNMRFNGNVDNINSFFDNVVGKEGSFSRFIEILNNSKKLEIEYSKTKFFKKFKIMEIKSYYNEAKSIIDTFNNNYHFK